VNSPNDSIVGPTTRPQAGPFLLWAIFPRLTPIRRHDEARELLDATDTSSIVGLRDRALMVCTFAPVGAATGMDVEDWYFQGRSWWVRLHEKLAAGRLL
jgi:hypothetical protein